MFLQVRFETRANSKIRMKRVSFRVEHAISSFRWREFRERGFHAIPRLISHFYPDKSRFLFAGWRTMLLIKSRKQLIFSLTETTVSSRDERAHAPLSLSLSLSFCYDTLSPARHFRVSCTAVGNFCHATSGMPPTFLETLLHQPISTISSFSAIFFRSPFHAPPTEKFVSDDVVCSAFSNQKYYLY